VRVRSVATWLLVALGLVLPVHGAGYLKVATSVTVTVGPFVADTDFKTVSGGLTISQADVRLVKHGSTTLAQKSEVSNCTHRENGFYTCPLDDTDTDTVGNLRLMITEAGALQVWEDFLVLPAKVFDSIISGSDNLETDPISWAGTAISAPSAAGHPPNLGEVRDLVRAVVRRDIDTDLSSVIASINADLGSGAGNYVAFSHSLQGISDDAESVKTEIGTGGDALVSIPWNSDWGVEVESEVADALVAIRLDHLLAADSDIDGLAPPTVGSIFHELMSKSTGSFTFDQETDSVEAVRDAISLSIPINHVATAGTAVTGTEDSGGYTQTHTDDDVYWQISPVSPAIDGFGLNVELDLLLAVGRVPSSLTVDGHFASGGGRTVQVWAYGYGTATWVQLSNSLTDFDHSPSTDVSFIYPMTQSMVDPLTGDVKIRLTSTSTTAADDWYVDLVTVSSVRTEAAGLTASAISQAVWQTTKYGHDDETLGFVLGHVSILQGKIVSATGPRQIVISGGVGISNAYDGMVLRVRDETDGHFESRVIVFYNGSTGELFLDRDLGFTPTTDDDFYISGLAYAPNPWGPYFGESRTITGTTEGDFSAVADEFCNYSMASSTTPGTVCHTLRTMQP
jgi:hypothetical protein